MFIAVQFPFADLRPFLGPKTHRLRLPGFPAPEDSEFLRAFGKASRRVKGGVEPWAGETRFCGARAALRFKLSLNSLKLPGKDEATVCRGRRFFSDGGAVSRLEIGFERQPSLPGSLTPAEGIDLITRCLDVPVSVPSGLADPIPLVFADRLLAEHLLAASTRLKEGRPYKTDSWWIRPGTPLLVVEHSSTELANALNVRRVATLEERGIALSHCELKHRGRFIGVWFLSIIDRVESEFLRRLRIYLFRLHAERECLKLVLHSVPLIKPRRGTKAFDGLQRYINDAEYNLTRERWFGLRQADVLEAAYKFDGIVREGERADLLALLARARPAVVKKVEHLVHVGNLDQERVVNAIVTGSGSHVNVERIVVGGAHVDSSKRINITGSQVGGDVIAADVVMTRIRSSEASPAMKDLLQELAVRASDMATQLPATRAEKVNQDLQVLTNEATSKTPRREWYELSAKGMIEAAETVAGLGKPVIETVKNIVGLLSGGGN